ncbi:MAG TPA: AEC family transporter, partial [Candidatus Hydrogenedentes bacterium]|nr:AEC family transporter [Candidatus Hydrogenedentota bacterium]
VFSLFIIMACVFLMMVPGYAAIRRAWMGSEGIMSLSRLMINVIYPCLIFTSVTEKFTWRELLRAWPLPAATVIIMLVGYAVGRLVCWRLRFPGEAHRRAFLFQTTVNNYSFFPMGLVAQLYGPEGVAALIFSTLGAEAAMWTLGVMTLSGAPPGKAALKHLLSPALLALYASLACLAVFDAAGIDPAVFTARGTALATLHGTAKAIGACTVPVAMIIGGARIAQLVPDDLRTAHVWLVSLLRLVGIPLLAVPALRMLPLEPMHAAVMIIVAVMPVSIASLMFSEVYGGDKALMGGSVLLTHVLALLTVPLLLALLL